LKIELAEEGVRKARWIDIARHARLVKLNWREVCSKDWCLFAVAIAFSVLRGLMMPLFSLVFGQIFAVCCP
jgi:hypothetical protein